MKEYHGIIVDASQKNKSVFKNLEIIGEKQAGSWILYKINVEPKKLDEIIKTLQQNMAQGNFYFHFYKNNKLIVVFKNRIFKTETNKSTWNEIIQYGKNLGIPEEQLDFYPCCVEDENY